MRSIHARPHANAHTHTHTHMLMLTVHTYIDFGADFMAHCFIKDICFFQEEPLRARYSRSYLHVCVYAMCETYTNIRIRIYIYTYVYMYVCVYTHICVCVYIYMYMYPYARECEHKCVRDGGGGGKK